MGEPKQPKPYKPRAPRTPPRDIAIVHGPTEDGQGRHVLRLRDGELSAGEIRPVKEGQPITQQELVRLRPLEAGGKHADVFEVEVLHDGAATQETTGTRHVRASNDRYRKNWSTVFESKRRAHDEHNTSPARSNRSLN